MQIIRNKNNSKVENGISGFLKLLLLGILLCVIWFFLAELMNAEASSGRLFDQIPRKYDGFLFSLDSEETASLLSDENLSGLEYVADDIYWADSLATLDPFVKDGRVEWMEPNYYVDLMDEETEIDDVDSDSDSEAITDGWAYGMIRAAYAEEYGLSGGGVRIGVIDSGLDEANPDLQGANILQGYDYVLGTEEMSDDIYHGTKLTQLISGDRNALGVTGAARGAEIVPLRCFASSGGGTVKILAQALYDAVDKYNCDIINMSWGLKTDSETLRKAIQHAGENHVIMVAAAGNVTSSYSQGTLLYPASYDEVISVSSINGASQAASSSQQNSSVFVCAPGESILFTDADGNTDYDSGTSFAAPSVTAAAALVTELLPSIQPEDLMAVLEERATDLGDSGWDEAYGYGCIQLDRILGATWGRRASTDDPDTSVLIGWLLHPGGGYVIAQEKNTDGRSKNIAIQKISKNAASYYFDVPAESEDIYSVYYLDECYAPLAKADVFSG